MKAVEPLAYGSEDEQLLFTELGHELYVTYGIDMLSVDTEGYANEGRFISFCVTTRSSLNSDVIKKRSWSLRRSDGFDRILQRVIGDIVLSDYKDSVMANEPWHAENLMRYALGLSSYDEDCAEE